MKKWKQNASNKNGSSVSSIQKTFACSYLSLIPSLHIHRTSLLLSYLYSLTLHIAWTMLVHIISLFFVFLVLFHCMCGFTFFIGTLKSISSISWALQQIDPWITCMFEIIEIFRYTLWMSLCGLSQHFSWLWRYKCNNIIIHFIFRLPFKWNVSNDRSPSNCYYFSYPFKSKETTATSFW